MKSKMCADKHRYRMLQYGALSAGLLMCHIMISIAAEEQKNSGQLVPGQEAEVLMPDNGRAMKVYLPSNYSADRKWPVILFFHAKNSTPTTSPVKEYVDGKDFVIVGMPYAADKEVPKTDQDIERILQKELLNVRSARAWVGQNLKVDANRVFMGGISMGGWATSTLAEYEMPRLAGMFILLGGRQRARTVPREVAALRSKPVYIGAGEADPNLTPSLKAVSTYRRYGAAVTYEIYFGKGHEMPTAVPVRFKSWLEAMGKWYAGNMNDSLRKTLDSILNTQLKEALAKDSSLAKYMALVDLEMDPRVLVASPEVGDEIRKQIRIAKLMSPGREESLAEKGFLDLAWQDINVKELHDLKIVRDGFKKLGAQYPEPFFGKYAAKYYECLAQMYQKALDSLPANQQQQRLDGGRRVIRPPAMRNN